jgi:hypothetical protein
MKNIKKRIDSFICFKQQKQKNQNTSPIVEFLFIFRQIQKLLKKN